MAMIFRTFFRLLYLFTNFVNFVLMWSVASLCDLLWLFSVQQHVAGVIRHASSSVLRRCVLYVFSLVSNKISTAVFKFTRHEHYWKWPYLHVTFHNKEHCRKVQRTYCQKVPPCPQAQSGTSKALHPGWVSYPHYSTTLPMEDASSPLPTSASPSSCTITRVGLVSLVSCKMT